MNGLSIFDFICKDQFDEETGETYKALTCCNNDDMAERCKVADALPVVYCIKATSDFNNLIALQLRTGIQNGKINFLISELDADEVLTNIYKGYDKLTQEEKIKLQEPYAQTTMAEYELVKLGYSVVNGNIKVQEKSGMRKDRYSSIAYNYYVANQLELELRPQTTSTEDLISRMAVRPAKYLRHTDRSAI